MSESNSEATLERRDGDRRRGGTSLRWPERRTGFDRRTEPGLAGWLAYRTWAVVTIIVALNVLNIIDFSATYWELANGASEGNPVMAAAYESSPWAALGFKVLVMALISVAIWRMRSYKRIVQFALLATVAYAFLTLYHVVGIAYLI